MKIKRDGRHRSTILLLSGLSFVSRGAPRCGRSRAPASRPVRLRIPARARIRLRRDEHRSPRKRDRLLQKHPIVIHHFERVACRSWPSPLGRRSAARVGPGTRSPPRSRSPSRFAGTPRRVARPAPALSPGCKSWRRDPVRRGSPALRPESAVANHRSNVIIDASPLSCPGA